MEQNKDNPYYEKVKESKAFVNSVSVIHDATRENWKPYGNYKASTMEEIAKKSRRL